MRKSLARAVCSMGVLAALLHAPLAQSEEGSGAWLAVAERDGVRVSQQIRPGRALPAVRATVEIAAGLYEVLAVIVDVPNQTRWINNCEETRVLSSDADLRATFYLRMGSPWPVWDRDAVLTSQTRFIDASHTLTEFHIDPDAAVDVVEGVVRMPRLEGHYALEALGPQRTRVEYELDLDAGGALPNWVAVRATRDDPLETLRKLRGRVAETRGRYLEFVKRWTPQPTQP